MATQHSEQQDSVTDRIQNELRIPQEQRRPLWTGVLVGLVIGVLIGWFVLGWGLFPVSYEGQAYANHLNDEAQADYLSAVADAYAARRDDAALALAQYRLSAFIGEGILTESIREAQTYILELQSTMPEDAVLTRDVLEANMRLENLNVLAGALRTQSDATAESATEQSADGAGAAQPDANAETSQPNSEAPPVTNNGERNGEGMSVMQWLLLGFFAVMLIGGGIFLLRYLTKRSDGDDDDRAHSQSNARWDDDPEDEPVNRAYTVSPHTTTSGTQATERPAELPAHTLAPVVDLDQDPDYGFQTDDNDDRVADSGAGSVYAQVDFDESDWPENFDAAETPLAAAVEESVTPINRAQAMRGMKIATNVAHFHIGISDYDQAFALIDPDSGINIGDCGVGVTMPGGLRENHPEEVVSLDVWLFDKLDEERIGNYKRVLISEYVIDHGLEANFADVQGAVGKPIVAQPELTFEIEGENLRLLCRVIEADYSDNGATKGIFTNVKVEMSVLKKR